VSYRHSLFLSRVQNLEWISPKQALKGFAFDNYSYTKNQHFQFLGNIRELPYELIIQDLPLKTMCAAASKSWKYSTTKQFRTTERN
jgi:hypothetical protein